MASRLFVACSPPMIPKQFLLLEQQKIIIVNLHQTIDENISLQILAVELIRVALCTEVRTLEGRIVTIPNCTFTDNSVVNVTSQPALKVKINLGLTYDTNEDDMQKAINILQDIVKNQDAITDDYAAGFNGFGDFSLNILFMYYVRSESHWLNTQTLVNKEVLKRFNEEGLEFAFPTQTIFKKEV